MGTNAHAGSFDDLWYARIARPPNGGIATFYNDKLTSSGERLRPYDTRDLTCASPTEKIGRRLRVTHDGKSIECRVNDYGPHPRLHRVLDLTPAGNKALGCNGYCTVEIERLP